MASRSDGRQQALPLQAPEVAPPPRSIRSGLALGFYILLRVVGWLAANIVGGFGMIVVLLLALSGGRVAALFAHLENLSSRYLAADAGRRLAFDGQLLWIVLLSALAILLIRLPAFIGRLRRELAETAR